MLKLIDLTGESFSFPSNWSPMQGNADYLSVDVGVFDPEYTNVYNDFCNKLGTRPTTFKVNQEYYQTPNKLSLAKV